MELRRSSLFVPVGVPRFYAKAAASGADAIVLDLEDAIPPDAKLQARAGLGAARQAVQARRCVIRVNADPDLLAGDIEGCAASGADEVLLPKVESAADLEAARQLIARHDGWRPALSILVETMEGVRRLPDLIRDGGPIASVALGMEDLAALLQLAAPGRSDPNDLRWLHAELLLRTVATSVVPLGLIGEARELHESGTVPTGNGHGVAIRLPGHVLHPPRPGGDRQRGLCAQRGRRALGPRSHDPGGRGAPAGPGLSRCRRTDGRRADHPTSATNRRVSRGRAPRTIR